MKVLIFYYPNSEHDSTVHRYVTDFENQTRRNIDLVNMNTPEGADQAKIYDITQYPAVVAVRDNGELVQLWEGKYLPLMNELSGYAEEDRTGKHPFHAEKVIQPPSSARVAEPAEKPTAKVTPAKKKPTTQ